ncbi:MAG: class I SAM-dependent methyltransferase [Nocardioides sp.]
MADQGTTTAAPASSNVEQARAWDGDEGRYWAANADRFDASLRAYHPLLLAEAAPGRADVVVDVGCGAGQTTLDLARLATGGTVAGIDLSGPMLDVARSRAATAGVINVRFVQADAQVHPLPECDLVVSRTGAMFFGDTDAAFANLAAALRPGGRIVLLVWQGVEHNEWLQRILGALAAGRDLPTPPPDAPGPFALSRPERVTSLLEGAGFARPDLRDLRRPMYFGETPEEATAFMHGLNAWMLADLDATTRGSALAALEQTMREHAGPDGVTFGSAMWLVTAARRT